MCAYNKVNGQSASENTWLLTTVLREEFGFEGLVVSDWGAVYHRVPALLAGLDLEMPPALGRSPEAVVAAVEAGEVPTEVLDARVRTVLELVAKGMPVLELDESFDAGRPPRPGPGGGRRVGRAAEERRAAAVARRRQDRGDRRVRPDPAVPGRRVVPGDADPGRRAARRAAGGLRRGAVRGRLRHRRHRRRRGPARRGRAGGRIGRHGGDGDRAARGRRVGGLRPDPHGSAGQPAGGPEGGGGGQPERRRRAGQRLDGRPRRRHPVRAGRWSRPGWAVRRPAARSPMC